MNERGGCFTMQLIGPFGLFDPEGRRIEIRSKKAMAMLALLATGKNGEHTREWLQAKLWGSRAQAQAQGSFRRELSNLAKLLDAHDAGRLLLRGANRIALALNVIDVDFLDLGAGRHGSVKIDRGEFLEGLDLRDCEEFESWLRERRNQCQQMQSELSSAGSGIAQQVLGSALPPVQDLLTLGPRSLPPKPSVAVMPFRTYGSMEFAESLGIGMAEEIELCLMRLRSLFVGATRSTMVLAGRGLTLTEIATDMGLRYIIDGKVEWHDDKVDVTVLLIDGANGHQVWISDFSGTIGSRVEMQREIARAVVQRIHSKIDLVELNEGLRNEVPSGSAYHLYWRANAMFRNWDEPSVTGAAELCAQLLEIDPTCAWGEAMAAFCAATCFAANWGGDRMARREAALRHMANAKRLVSDDPMVMGYLAATMVLLGESVEVADQLIDDALAMIPGHQPTLFWGGYIDLAMGRPARARERLELSLRINPEAGVRANTLSGIGIAMIMQGDFASAHNFMKAALDLIPGDMLTLAGMAFASWHCGVPAEARAAVRRMREQGDFQTVFAVLRDSAFQSAFLQTVAAIEASAAPAHLNRPQL